MRASKAFAWIPSTIAALLGGCGVRTAVVGGDGSPIGTVRVTSATFGNVALAPAACASGEHQLFLGADFLDRARGAALRLILGPTGEATLRVFDTARPLDPGIVFHRAACSKALIAFERTGWRIDDIYDVRVSLELDCRNASGDSLQGTLSVAHCH
jgi:hypothetical protein